MNYHLNFLRKADEDLIEAYNWYEEKSHGLGSDFFKSFEIILNKIKHNPFLYPIIYKNTRRALLKRFPYAIFYTVEENLILVIACFHCMRNPRIWKYR